jgi:hypothetical protein
VRDPVKPGGQRGAGAGRAGLPAEDQERRLGGVLRVLVVVEDAGAQAVDEGGVAADEGGEGVAVALGDETTQQLRVGQVALGGLGGDPQERAKRSGLPSDHPRLLNSR